MLILDGPYLSSVPRTRGDEPAVQSRISQLGKCSPHTRG